MHERRAAHAAWPGTKVIKSLYGDDTVRISTNNDSTPWVAEQPVDIADFGDTTPYCAPVAFYELTSVGTDRLQRGVNIVRRGCKTMKTSVR